MDLQAHGAGSYVSVLLTQVSFGEDWSLLAAFMAYLLSVGYLTAADEGAIAFSVSFVHFYSNH